MASSVTIKVDPSLLRLITDGAEAVREKQRIGEEIATRWKAYIHDVTGATDASINVETRGSSVVVAAEGPESAWLFREYGTYSQRAERPGRRALKEV